MTCLIFTPLWVVSFGEFPCYYRLVKVSWASPSNSEWFGNGIYIMPASGESHLGRGATVKYLKVFGPHDFLIIKPDYQ